MTEKTPEELRGQRARLIASTGLTETVLRERAEAHQLYPEHHDIWATVEGIDYLLSDAAEAPEVDEPHFCKLGTTVYYCPTAGATESDCHGGFDVCCFAPRLHQQLIPCGLAYCRQAHPPHSWAPQPGMTPVRCEGYSSDPATTWSPDPCGRTVPHPTHKFMRGRAAHQCPGAGQQTVLAAGIECAIGLNTGGGGADGVYAARDAVLAVLDQELERLRARLNRVQAIADQLAAHSRLGVDFEADSIRRGIAQQLHNALGTHAG